MHIYIYIYTYIYIIYICMYLRQKKDKGMFEIASKSTILILL